MKERDFGGTIGKRQAPKHLSNSKTCQCHHSHPNTNTNTNTNTNDNTTP